MALTEMSESFFFKDVTSDGVNYRMFNYRLCPYSEYLYPSALECRGIMFEVDSDMQCVDIAARPMQKFFNDKENPFTEDIDYSKTVSVMIKADGSLISTYIHKGHLKLKTKGSIDSDQAVAAMKWILLPEHSDLYVDLTRIAQTGNTINMEWTSPNNRIILGYEEDALVILNIRNNYTGEYTPYHSYPTSLRKYVVEDVLDGIADIDTFIGGIKDERGNEGYVIRLEDGQLVKHKTEWYLHLHRNKESVNSPKKLLAAVINETADDLLTLFTDDPSSVNIINTMIERVTPIYNRIIGTVERFCVDNKELSRKDYAIKALGLDDKLMPLYMNAYTGKENDFKKFSIKNFEMFIDE